jgi:hypothetical protein
VAGTRQHGEPLGYSVAAPASRLPGFITDAAPYTANPQEPVLLRATGAASFAAVLQAAEGGTRDRLYR